MSLTTNNQGGPEPGHQPASGSELQARKNLGPQDGDRSEIWKRGLLMLAFLICFGLGHSILIFITVVQFAWLAIYCERNEFVVRFGRSLARWLSDAALFLCGASEDKPFPWAPWPSA